MEQSFWELLTEVNWKMIVLTLVAGGALSIIGDRVGMKFAKRRVTLFNLRPRYTSSLLTAVTGMMISLVVIVMLAIVSESVRISLFSMQFIQRQIIDLTRQLQDSRNEQQVSALLIVEAQQQLDNKQKELDGKTAELNGKTAELAKLQTQADELSAATDEIRAERDRLAAERDSLEDDVRRVRETLGHLQEGRIVVFSDERLAQEVIPEGAGSRSEALRCLERLDERVRYEVARRSSTVPASVVVEEDEGSRDGVVERILAYDSRKVVRAFASHNIAAGETVHVIYRVFESSLVFSQNEPLITRVVRFDPDADQAEVILSTMLRRLNSVSGTSGIITDALTGMVGSIPANDFYDAVERIAAAPAPLRVTVLAAGDIYSEGPVSVKIDVRGADEEPPSAVEEQPDLTSPEQIRISEEPQAPERRLSEASLR